jgi:hypothetical protein
MAMKIQLKLKMPLIVVPEELLDRLLKETGATSIFGLHEIIDVQYSGTKRIEIFNGIATFWDAWKEIKQIPIDSEDKIIEFAKQFEREE